MDDLYKEALSVWKLRISLEGIKKKIRRLEAVTEMEEFSQAFNKAERDSIRKDLVFLRSESAHLEATQTELEEKIQLPNPYFRKSD